MCGNGNVAVLQWELGLFLGGGKDYVAAQGRSVGHDGRIKVSIDPQGEVRIGGSCVTCVEGTLGL